MICPRTFLVAIVLLVAAVSPRPAPRPNPNADERLAKLTLEEKASLVTGRNSTQTCPVPRLGIPPVWLADGPVGLRKRTGAKPEETVPATCFPCAAAMAATWNPSLVQRASAAIATEARAHDVALLLAPGLNIKRHPLGGRNFEYYSEDPRLGGVMAAAFVRGVESEGIGATLKHFAANNQEYRRMTIDARVTERALREIYLRGFEIALRECSPLAVMSAYNRVNGAPASEDPRLLTEILRGEWGFEGLVVSDWGAVDDPVAAIAAGLDLEMPGSRFTPPKIVDAVRGGRLEPADLDRAVARVLRLVDRWTVTDADRPKTIDTDAHHALAREVAIESMVLLQNDGFLPLAKGDGAKLGIVGQLAAAPRIQGVGSSQVNALREEAALPFLLRHGAEQGYSTSSWTEPYPEDGLDARSMDELDAFLDAQDLLLVFAGQKASQDSEAADRSSMALAPAELDILERVRASGKPFGVVLVGGASIDVSPFRDEARAVLMSWLGGQAWGIAVADLVFGKASPCGKLTETFARSVDDHPSALNFPGGPKAVEYGEGLYVGYRYFQTFDREVAYPFGHGLAYTTFEYTKPKAPAALTELGPFEVSVDVCNVGDRAGDEIVQVYARHLAPPVARPDRELVGFAKVSLAAGETGRATISLDTRDLAYFSDAHSRWIVEPGRYEILIGASAADIRATLPLALEIGDVPARTFTLDDVFLDVCEDPQGRALTEALLQRFGRGSIEIATEDDHFAAVLNNLPFKKLKNFSNGILSDETVLRLLELVNGDLPPDEVPAKLQQIMAAQRAAEKR